MSREVCDEKKSAIKFLQDELEQERQARAKAEGLLRVRSKELSDVTRDLLQRHNELKEAQNQLIQSEKMASLGTIAAGVAHEINNPLAFIMSNTSTLEAYVKNFLKVISHLRENQKDPSQWEELEEEYDLEYICGDIQNMISETIVGIDRVTEIVKNLKSFARVDQSEKEIIDINDCIESTLKVVWNEIKYKCELTKELRSTYKVLGNTGQINQVILNLLVNASHAISSKGEISISTHDTKNGIVFRVCDNGIGMDSKLLSKIFNPFFTTKPAGQGTGLGLSVSYGIMEDHGGRIAVTSEEGSGTTFELFFPKLEVR